MSYEDEFGELVLVTGDFFIPQRTKDIPKQFKELMVLKIQFQSPNKVQSLICTGNIGNKETLDWLKSLSSNFICVKGDLDDLVLYNYIKTFPEFKIFQMGKFKIGVIHGHQILPWGNEEQLYAFLRENNLDILISGQTHEQKISNVDGKYLINPGSATGVYNSQKKLLYFKKSETQPSFVLLELKEVQITVYLYRLDNNQLLIEKVLINKE